MFGIHSVSNQLYFVTEGDRGGTTTTEYSLVVAVPIGGINGHGDRALEGGSAEKGCVLMHESDRHVTLQTYTPSSLGVLCNQTVWRL